MLLKFYFIFLILILFINEVGSTSANFRRNKRSQITNRTLSNNERYAFLHFHNKARALVAEWINAAMRVMYYSTELEANALHFAEQCSVVPEIAPHFKLLDTSSVELNIFDQPDYLYTIGELISEWAKDQDSYERVKIQTMVDPEAWLIGCGRATCYSIKRNDSYVSRGSSITTCYYYSGKANKQPNAAPCSDCSDKIVCGNGTEVCDFEKLNCHELNANCTNYDVESCICLDYETLNKTHLANDKIIIRPYDRAGVITFVPHFENGDSSYDEEIFRPGTKVRVSIAIRRVKLVHFIFACEILALALLRFVYD